MNNSSTSRTRRRSGLNRFAALFFYVVLLSMVTAGIVLINGLSSPAETAYPPGIMPSSQVRAGMRGYGLSVFKGTRVERFPVVVVGKLKNALSEADMILIRVTGGYPAYKQVGIIAGMSGSPVYINGRLIGAIGYGWGFTKEPIGGVTPIEHMLRDRARNYKKKKNSNNAYRTPPPNEFFLDRPIYANGKRYNRVMVRHDYLRPTGATPPDMMVMSPVPAMLQVQGFHSKTVQLMEEKLKPLGLQPVSAPSGRRVPKGRGYRVRPGSPIGVTMVEGDLHIGGTGTVTYRNGDTILAFGHPMLWMGTTNMPLNAAYIEGIMPSIWRPFKLSSSMGIVGTMTQDRMYAISGRLGQKPNMYPMTVTVKDVERNSTRKFNLRVCENNYLNPVLMLFVGIDATLSSSSSFKKTAAEAEYRIKLKGYEEIVFTDYVYSWDSNISLGMQMMDYFYDLTRSEFDPADIESVKLNVKMYPEPKVARIMDVSTQFQRVRPGDRPKVVVTLKDEKGNIIQKKIELPIPGNFTKGVVRVGVCGKSRLKSMENKLKLRRLPPASIHQIVDRLRTDNRSNEIILVAALPGKTLAFYGERFRNLPPSIGSILVSSPRGTVKNSLDYYRDSLKMDSYVMGSKIINIRISKSVPSIQDGYEDVDMKSVSMKNPSMKNISVMGVESRKKAMEGAPEGPYMAAKSSKKKDKKKKVHTGSFEAAISSVRDYFQGVFKGTTVINGNVKLGYPVSQLYKSEKPFIMAMHREKGANKITLVESPGGDVIEILDGKAKKIGSTREILSTCMTAGLDGAIYIGTGPNGRIFRKKPNGKLEIFCTLKEDIVWDLKVEPSGKILAACGARANVYRIDPDTGKAKSIFNPSESHATALELTPEGEIFVGCSNDGAIYKIDAAGKASPYYRTETKSIDDLLYDKGDLWIASDELLYKLGGNGKNKVYFFPEESVIRITKDQNDNIFAATSVMGRVYWLNKSKGDRMENLFEKNINQVFDVDIMGSEMIMITGNPAGVYRIKNRYQPRGYFYSKVIDTGRMSRFGNVRWTVDTPEGTSVKMQTRSGNSPSPDNSWSDWSYEYSMKEGQQIKSPPARFVQVRAELTTTKPHVTPTLYEMAVYYSHLNYAPLMEFDSPTGGEKWSGNKYIKWKAFSGSPYSIAFNLFYSKDGGNKWKAIDWNIEPSLKNGDKSGKKPVKLKKKWRTRSMDDGEYLLKVVGFDKREPDNKYLQTTIYSKPIIINNKDPEVTILSHEVKGDQVIITGFVKTNIVNVKQVIFKQRGEKWALAFPEDGVFDNTREKFKIYINYPFRRRIRIKVKATDEAGNETTADKSFYVKYEKKEEKEADNGDNSDDGNNDNGNDVDDGDKD